MSLSPLDRAKFAAAKRAVAFVEDGMRLGLGTGSTAEWMLRCLAERVANEGLRVRCVPTSRRTEEHARALGLPLSDFDTMQWLDLTIDGADEIDSELNLIKGGGGALLREKIVAAASDRVVIIADPTKEVQSLGAFPLPVEVVPFGWRSTRALVEEVIATADVLNIDIRLRMDGTEPYRTDQGNFIFDLALGRIGNPRSLARALNAVPGVVDNGLFLDLCDQAVIGFPDGRVKIRDVATGVTAEERLTPPEPDNIFRDL